MWVCRYACIGMYLQVCMYRYVCTYVCVCVCVCVYIYIYKGWVPPSAKKVWRHRGAEKRYLKQYQVELQIWYFKYSHKYTNYSFFLQLFLSTRCREAVFSYIKQHVLGKTQTGWVYIYIYIYIYIYTHTCTLYYNYTIYVYIHIIIIIMFDHVYIYIYIYTHMQRIHPLASAISAATAPSRRPRTPDSR